MANRFVLVHKLEEAEELNLGVSVALYNTYLVIKKKL